MRPSSLHGVDAVGLVSRSQQWAPSVAASISPKGACPSSWPLWLIWFDRGTEQLAWDLLILVAALPYQGLPGPLLCHDAISQALPHTSTISVPSLAPCHTL